MTMIEKILDVKSAVKVFFVSLAFFIFSFLSVKFFILPHFSEVNGSLGPFESVFVNLVSYTLDSLIQVFITTFILAVAYVLFVPKEVRLKQFKSVSPKDIRHELNVNLNSTSHYWFRGRSARWFRSVAIPALVSNAQSNSRTVTINVLLPDPSSESAIKNYVSYRKSISKSDGQKWNVWSVQKEIISTISVLCHINSNNALVNVKLGLLDSYSLLRSDITDVSAVLTREDTKQIAMQFVRGTHLYDTYKEEILQGIQQGKSININNPIFSGRELDEDFVYDVLNELGFGINCNDQVKDLLQNINNPVNPYE